MHKTNIFFCISDVNITFGLNSSGYWVSIIYYVSNSVFFSNEETWTKQQCSYLNSYLIEVIINWKSKYKGLHFLRKMKFFLKRKPCDCRNLNIETSSCTVLFSNDYSEVIQVYFIKISYYSNVVYTTNWQ